MWQSRILGKIIGRRGKTIEALRAIFGAFGVKKTNAIPFNSLKTKNKSQFLKVAYVSKAHGIKGEIFVCPFNIKAEWPQPLREIFIGESAFSVKKYSHHKEGIIFELENCHSRQEAESLKAQFVFLPAKNFKSNKGEEIYLAELTSFCVELLGQGEIGNIQSFKSDKFQGFFTCYTKRAKC